jgi:hypothetical protein
VSEQLPQPIDAKPLTTADRSRLAELEQVIDHGLQIFVEVGRALQEVRDGRLYRETHETFEAYLDGRWGMSRSRGYRLIDAAAVAEIVSPNGDIANEAQARELVPLLRDEGEQAVVEVYRELRDEYGAADVTAKKVRSLVKRRLERQRRELLRSEERAKLQAQFVDAAGRKRKFEERVTYSTPKAALANDYLRIVDGVKRLRSEIGGTMFRQAAEAFCGHWTPDFSIGNALRGRRAATPERQPAADLLQPVYRDLFDREDVADALRAVDAAIEAERTEFLADFAAWLEERADRIGETLEPHYDRLLDIIDSLPETQLEAGCSFVGRYVEDGAE